MPICGAVSPMPQMLFYASSTTMLVDIWGGCPAGAGRAKTSDYIAQAGRIARPVVFLRLSFLRLWSLAPDRQLERYPLEVALIRHGAIAVLQVHHGRQQLQ